MAGCRELRCIGGGVYTRLRPVNRVAMLEVVPQVFGGEDVGDGGEAVFRLCRGDVVDVACIR